MQTERVPDDPARTHHFCLKSAKLGKSDFYVGIFVSESTLQF